MSEQREGGRMPFGMAPEEYRKLIEQLQEMAGRIGLRFVPHVSPAQPEEAGK